MIAFELPDVQFNQIFRMKIECEKFITELEPFANRRASIPIHLKVLATLNFAATGSFQNPVGCNCWVSLTQSSVCRILNEICSIVTQHIFTRHIKFPTEREDKNSVKQRFYERWQTRGVFEGIDGTHVEISAPPLTDPEHPPFVYINRKGKHSINVMLISDSDTKIIGCTARYPGSVHDLAIWQMSNIKNYLQNEHESGDKLSHLIGDSGYPLERYM